MKPYTPSAKSLLKRRYDELKILGTGELTKSLKIAAHRFSSTAREKIEKAGGVVTVLPGRRPMAAPPSDASGAESV